MQSNLELLSCLSTAKVEEQCFFYTNDTTLQSPSSSILHSYILEKVHRAALRSSVSTLYVSANGRYLGCIENASSSLQVGPNLVDRVTFFIPRNRKGDHTVSTFMVTAVATNERKAKSLTATFGHTRFSLETICYVKYKCSYGKINCPSGLDMPVMKRRIPSLY